LEFFSKIKYLLLRDYMRGIRGLDLVNEIRRMLPGLPVGYAGAMAQLVRAAFEAGVEVGRGERVGRREMMESLTTPLARELAGAFPCWKYNVEVGWGWPGEEGVGRQRVEITSVTPMSLDELEERSEEAMRRLVQMTPYEFGGPEYAGQVVLGQVTVISAFPAPCD
jgi:hypothetical protein